MRLKLAMWSSTRSRVAGQCGVTCAEGGDVVLGGAHDAALAQDDLVLLVHGPVPLPCTPHLIQHIQLMYNQSLTHGMLEE